MAGYGVTYTVVDNATKQIDAINRRLAAMRAPVERLSRQVSRFVDLSGLRKVQQGFEWIGRAAGTVLRTLTAIVPVAGALFGAASIAGVAKLVQSFAGFSHELQQNADNIGMTTQQLQQFQDAARLAGGNANDMTEGLKGLHTAVSNIAIGQGGTDAIQWFQRLGINIRDASGHMRTAADLMPEVEQKIAAIKDPMDRARAATALLGASGDKLVETFRQSHQTLGAWFADAGRYTDLTEQQKDAFQSFNEAVGRSATAFDHLGQQVSATLATNLTPLINALSEFVEKHTPEIVAAVDQISKEFADWLQGVDWTKVQQGIDSAIDGLKFMVGHLDDIKIAVEAIAALFAAKWAISIVASVAQVTAALGSAGAGAAGAAGGTGMLGALGAVAAIAASLAAAYGVKQGLEAGSEKLERGIFGDKRVEERKRLDAQGQQQFMRQIPSWLGGTGGTWGGAGTLLDRALKGPEAIQREAAPMNLPKANMQRATAVRDRLAADFNLSTDQAAGIVGNLQAESGIQAVQEGAPTSGRGGYGWAQWTGPRRDAFEKWSAENKLDPKSDEANYGFLKQELQSNQYAGTLDRIRQSGTAGQSAQIFENEYERPAPGSTGRRMAFASQVAQAQAPAVAAPGAPPVNGAVDVNITHKNAPPNSSVTAQGSGAVNVAPVRVEHQDMASI
jgi:hypothetical protein